MSMMTQSCRRRLGLICIALAVIMLIAGETVLKSSLTGVALLCYWMGCFILTVAAAAVAIMDVAMVRRGLREQQRSLLEETLREVEREKQARKKAKP